MTRLPNSTDISTLTPKRKILSVPSGMKMGLSMFGVDVEQIENLINDVFADTDVTTVVKNVFSSLETVQRVEKKLDLICKHLNIEIPEEIQETKKEMQPGAHFKLSSN